MRTAWLVVTTALAATACAIGSGTAPPPAPPEPSVTTVGLVTRYSVACETRSPAGYGAGFYDPRKGGECWACPNSNHVRTAAPVTAANACGKDVLGLGRVARAKYLGPHGKCPAGDVQARGACRYCPSGSRWSTKQGACVQG